MSKSENALTFHAATKSLCKRYASAFHFFPLQRIKRQLQQLAERNIAVICGFVKAFDGLIGRLGAEMLRPSLAATADQSGAFRSPSMPGLFLPRNARPWFYCSNLGKVLRQPASRP